MDVYVDKKKIRIQPRNAIGKGGEAEVYDIGGGRALKLFKPPDHPDFAAAPGQARAARQRLDEQQHKLKDFPQCLGAPVVSPMELAYDAPSSKRSSSPHRGLVGYTMRRIKDSTPLLSFGDRSFRQRGVGVGQVFDIFLQLHDAITEIHRAGVVLGDFNDLNVLVTGAGTSPRIWLIDADSFQFGPYQCRVYTERFVDPRLCDPAAPAPQLSQPHDIDSDWYAFTVMLVRSLLLTDPYGGIYKPRGAAAKVPAPQRPLRRITIFHPDVRYPKPAHPREILSDEWLGHLDQVFHHDARGLFPRALLEGAAWTTCGACGLEHARRACPSCRHGLAMTPPPRTVTGRVEWTLLLRTEGHIVAVSTSISNTHQASVRWLVHEAETFRREDGSIVLEGPRHLELSFGLLGSATLVARGDRLMVLDQEGPKSHTMETFASNGRHLYRIKDGRLLRDGPLGPVLIGEVLAGQTSFWVGDHFGFGIYRAGRITVAFVFEADGVGLNDNVHLPPLPGQWLDVTCTFTDQRCWLLITARAAGRTRCHVVVARRDGTVEARLETTDGGDPRATPWLRGLRGACAMGDGLLVPTDEGIVRIGIVEDQLLEKGSFPDTEPYLDAGSRLFASAEGLVVAGSREIRRLVIKK